MAQSSDFVVDDGSGTLLLSQLNTMLPALASGNSGATAPLNPYPFMFWGDTSVTPAVLRQRNAANTAWIALGPETVAAKTIRGNSGAAAAAIADIDMATLKTMLGYGGNIAASGYEPLPNGLIRQWGTTGAIAAGGGNMVTFQSTFPTACFGVHVTPVATVNNTAGFSVGFRGLTTSTFVATNNSGSSGPVVAFWEAIGN